jgi:hypothetical protein
VSAIDEARPDYLLILPWNLRQEIASQLRYTSEWGCQLIVPIPEVQVINPRQANHEGRPVCGGLGTRIRDYSESTQSL